MTELPLEFKNNILDLHGSDYQEWLDKLPSLLHSIEKSWRIHVSAPHDSLTYNYVAFAENNKSEKLILKIGLPGEALNREVNCLKVFNGKGAAKILKYDYELGAMLLERIEPGYNIIELDESEAMHALSYVIKKIHTHQGTSKNFPTVQDWGLSFKHLRDQFDGGSGPLPSDLVDDGERIYKNLIESMSSTVLLHGDLHHGNILAGTRKKWIAIDPKGVIGEPEFDVGAFLRNPMSILISNDDVEDLIKRRIDTISKMTGYNKERITQWGFAQAVLSAIWAFEDYQAGWENVLKIARVIRKII